MSARTRRYVMALKPGAEAMPDLKDRLARMPDVAVLGQSPRQVQVEATPEAAARLREEIASHYRLEEVTSRQPL
ncbi:MAG TPA: hypothetical protein VEX11_18035 [Acetobacteraceae bacterium]|nr:hypothetical protein [Acetobacteraceae bacterium]